MRILIAIVCLLALRVQGATVYVRSGASGANNGTSWTDAYTSLPGNLPRGTTAYIATGSYGQVVFTTPVSGSTYIYFRKATVSDHGGGSGWNDAYGTGQAVFSYAGPLWDLRTSYLDFEGVTGSGTNSTYGFKLSSSYTTGFGFKGCVDIPAGQSASFINLRHVEMVGTGPDVDCAHQSWGISIESAGQHPGFTVQNCFIHEVAQWCAMNWTPNSVIDHNYFRNAGSSCMTDHGVGISWSGANMQISFNVFENMLGPSQATYLEAQGGGGQGVVGINAQIYGNVWRATSASESTTQWANFSCVAANWTTGLRFYNNTSYGLHGPVGVSVNAIGDRSNNVVPGGDNRVQNNIWINCPQSDGLGSLNVANNNGWASGAMIGDVQFTGSFVDAAHGDFHLSANSVSGITLAAPFNTDPDGAIRQPGSWSLGAYQFVGAPPPPQAPNQPSNLIPAAGATGIGLTTLLAASAYSDPTAKPQTASQWLVLDGGNNTVWDSGTAAAAASTSVPAGRLTYSTTYSWRVRYQNSLALWSTYSVPTAFTTVAPQPPATPTNVTPANGAVSVGLLPALTASAYSDPQSSPQIASQWRVYQGINLIWDSGNRGPVNTFTVTTLLTPGTIYMWQVRYASAFGLWSAWSAATAFTTLPVYAPQQPVNVTPASGAANVVLTPTLTATPFNDPNTPALAQLASEWLVLSNLTTLLDTTAGAVTNLAIGSGVLTNSSLYVWSVRYQNVSNLWSSYSVPTAFTTTNGPAPPPPTTNTITLQFNGTITLKGTWKSQ